MAGTYITSAISIILKVFLHCATCFPFSFIIIPQTGQWRLTSCGKVRKNIHFIMWGRLSIWDKRLQNCGVKCTKIETVTYVISLLHSVVSFKTFAKCTYLHTLLLSTHQCVIFRDISKVHLKIDDCVLLILTILRESVWKTLHYALYYVSFGNQSIGWIKCPLCPIIATTSFLATPRTNLNILFSAS